MDLSIVILNYKTKDLIRYCIKNIKDTVKQVSYEIIVVDNASYDGIARMMQEEYPDVVFIQNTKNVGFGAGNNVGIRAARGRYITIMNPDVFVQEGALDEIVRYMDKHADVGMVGPKLLNGNNTLQYSCMKFQSLRSIVYRRTPLGKTKKGQEYLAKYLMMDWDHNDIRDVDWVMGACQTVRASVLDEVGLYDEQFFFYVEDMEWCRRFWIHGKRVVYVPSARMYHLHEQASMTSPWGFLKMNRFVRWHIISFVKYMIKYWRNSNYGTRR